MKEMFSVEPNILALYIRYVFCNLTVKQNHLNGFFYENILNNKIKGIEHYNPVASMCGYDNAFRQANYIADCFFSNDNKKFFLFRNDGGGEYFTNCARDLFRTAIIYVRYNPDIEQKNKNLSYVRSLFTNEKIWNKRTEYRKKTYQGKNKLLKIFLNGFYKFSKPEETILYDINSCEFHKEILSKMIEASYPSDDISNMVMNGVKCAMAHSEKSLEIVVERLLTNTNVLAYPAIAEATSYNGGEKI